MKEDATSWIQVAAAQLFFDGTFAPFRLASERPMAMACFRLLTFFPLPLRSVPFFRLCMVFLTDFWVPLPYLAIVHSLVNGEPSGSAGQDEPRPTLVFAQALQTNVS